MAVVIDMMISELLCYALRKYGSFQNNGVEAIIVSFYNANEIIEAKELLFKTVDDMKVDDMPRVVSQRKTEDKARIDVDDIFSLIDALDERRLLDSLPKFVAHDPAKLPPFKTSDLDMCLLSLRVAALEDQLEKVVSRCIESMAVKTVHPDIYAVASSMSSFVEPVAELQTKAYSATAAMTSGLGGDSVSVISQTQLADLANGITNEDFQVVSHGRKTASTVL